MLFPSFSAPSLTLGTYGSWPARRAFRIPLDRVKTHAHIIGVSESGKSTFLANAFLALYHQGLPATLIDPHGDLAELILAQLVARGVFRDTQAFERIIYLDLPGAERSGRYLPFNVLQQRVVGPTGEWQDAPRDTIASYVKDAFHRAWPELSDGAATFDTLLPDSVMLLEANRLPITAIHQLLVDGEFREQLLARETDGDLVRSFRNVYDALRGKADQVQYAGSVLRRARQLTQLSVFKYGLGQPEMALDFRRIIEAGQTVIINLSFLNADVRRLLGCFLTVAAEQGAMSRTDALAAGRKTSHHLFIDEFSEFTKQSESAMTTMLSQTRKFGLYLWMAHQNWSQASARLRGAMQNVGLEVAFRLGRDDAEYVARVLGRVDPRSVSHREAADTEGVGIREQWEGLTQELQELLPGHAYVARAGIRPHGRPLRWFVKRPPRWVQRVTTPYIGVPAVDAGELAAVKQHYLQQYFRPVQEIRPFLAFTESAEALAAPPRRRQV